MAKRDPLRTPRHIVGISPDELGFSAYLSRFKQLGNSARSIALFLRSSLLAPRFLSLKARPSAR